MHVPVAPNPQSGGTAVQADPTISPANREAGSSTGLVDVLLEIGRERQRTMEAMKAALLRGDDDAALEHACDLTGLPSRKSRVTAVTT
jgi:hypothetical protein